MNEYYGAPTTPTSDYLVHYGVKGMKWGVRRAREKGGKVLDRQFKKDARYLAKLQKRATSGKKYAKRAAALGAGAAGMGAVAAVGTHGVGAGMKRVGNLAGAGVSVLGRGMSGLGELSRGIRNKHIRNVGMALDRAGRAVTTAGHTVAGATNKAGVAVQDWGKTKTIGSKIYQSQFANPTAMRTAASINTAARNLGYNSKHTIINDISDHTNSGYVRAGAAAIGAGLAGGAAYNAYRALTTKKNAERASTFRKEMNKAYAGTKYANQYMSRKKRRG